MANNKSGQAVSRTIPIETIETIETSNNYKLQQANKHQQANKFKSQQAPAPTSGTQNIQGDNGKQANNSGTQYQPNFAFSQTAPATATTSGFHNSQRDYGKQNNTTTSGFHNSQRDFHNSNTGNGKQNINTGNQTFGTFSF